MTCTQPRDLLGPYFDGELVGDERGAMDVHVCSCGVCATELDDLRSLRAGLTRIGRPSAPAVLADRIRRDLAENVSHRDGRSTLLGSARTRPRLMWAGAAAAAGLVAVVTLASLNRIAAPGRLENEVLAAHLRSLIQDSPVQVASAESHMVKPWFAGRVDFAPSVKDLTAKGYPLVGGRLDYVGNRRVAALVYMRRKHVVSIFMWAASDRAAAAIAPIVAMTLKGHNILGWTNSGITYWAVSDLNLTELAQLQQIL